MSLKSRVKKLERARRGEADVIFFHIYHGDKLDSIIARVNDRSGKISEAVSEAIEECRREHPGVEVRVPSPIK